jgi:hypothetical protein
MPYRWTGDAWVIHPRFQKQADAAFAIGETRMMVEVEERSEASHKQEFAWLREAWLSLPESIAREFPSPEHLRKRALIATGWCTMTDYVCSSGAEAIRWAANLRKEVDEYALVIVERSVVRVMKAKSQSRKAMRKDDFQASKTAILEWVAGLLDVAPETLARVKEAA